ncbi:hypothetical protein [Burkholderia glumae]|uniref:hypothetical protein n=1 Tax=Burkholderia glumae TaxID=337 RepID=UPI0020962FC7|nr:hypothetical protein [Burkholderia glumae]
MLPDHTRERDCAFSTDQAFTEFLAGQNMHHEKTNMPKSTELVRLAPHLGDAFRFCAKTVHKSRVYFVLQIQKKLMHNS